MTCRRYDGSSLERKRDIKIGDDILLAAASNESCHESIFKLLFNYGIAIRVTENVLVKVAARLKDEVVALLLEKGEGTQITESILKAAAENWLYGKNLMRMLLSRSEQDAPISEKVMVAAAGNRRLGEALMTTFLEFLKRSKQPVPISKEVMIAAVRNNRHSEALTTMLLERSGQPAPISEGVMIAAVGNKRQGEALMMVFLEQAAPISEKVVKAAVMAPIGNGVLKILRDRGCLDKCAPKWGKEARFRLAVSEGDVDLVQQLIDEGVEYDRQYDYERTPLKDAVYYGKVEIVKILLDSPDLNYDRKEESFSTPLHIAVSCGQKSCARLLLEKGAYSLAEDTDGDSPRSLAWKYYNKTLEEWIAEGDKADTESNSGLEDSEGDEWVTESEDGLDDTELTSSRARFFREWLEESCPENGLGL